jgi:autotransporter-associated beta strand protein
MARRLLLVTALLWAAFLLPHEVQAQRQLERLGRGVIAHRISSTQVYVGWRLLGNDPEDIAFNLYRSANSAAPVKINATPITASTNYLDTPANLGTTAYTYSVKPVLENVEVADVWAHPATAAAILPLNAAPLKYPYLRVPLQPTPDGAHDVKFCWVGDLDGNGEFDFVVDRQPPTAARQFLEAYKPDGTLLWRIDMGPNSTNHYNIEPGSSTISIGHGDNVTVADMDGDGKAEVLLRTSNGVIFANGTTVTHADNRVQFMSVINGQTGVELARAQIPNPFLSDGQMQGHMGILFCDGLRPSVFYHYTNRRDTNGGDMGFNGMCTTWDYRSGVISQRWSRDLNTLTHEAAGHQIRFGDPDNDGKDEYLDVGHGLNDDGTQLYANPEIVHGDRFHIGDIDPDRPGIETFVIQQNNGAGLATALYESATGVPIKKWYAGGVVDVGRGSAADIDPAHKGYEMVSTQPGIFNAKGVQISPDNFFPVESIWWDADLSREYLQPNETVRISKYDNGLGYFDLIDRDTPAPGAYLYYAGRPAFWGDIIGDWREEMVTVENGNGALRIYTTPRVAPNRIYTLMHNPQYRAQTTTKGYVQSSAVDYYLGTGMTVPQPPPIVEAKLVWRGGAGATTWDAGATSSWMKNGVNSVFTQGDTVRFDLSGNNTTAVTLNGTLMPGAMTVYNPKDYIFGGAGSLAGAMKLTKAGAGTLTLPGVHSFSGRTTVWDGALVVNGELQQSPVTVWGGTFGGVFAKGEKGGRIAGTGKFSQPVTVKYRGTITPGAGMNNVGVLTFGSGLALEDGSTVALDLSDDPTGVNKPNDRLAITGNLALSGKVNIVIRTLNANLAPGTYTLLNYSGTLTGSTGNLAVVLPAGIPYTLAASGGAVTLTVPVTRAAGAVVWRGTGANWDLAASQNWLKSNVPDVFVSGDSVTFDATGASNPVVNLAAGLPVGGLTVNAATNYTFNGSGFIGGPGGLAKSGAGILTINTANEYTGPTTITGGVLAVSALGDAGVPSSIGASGPAASNLVLNGGALRLTGSQTNTNRNITLGAGGGTLGISTASSSMQISGVLSGPGSLTKDGPGTLLLADNNTYSGGTVINGGTIYLAGAGPNVFGLGSGSVTINNGTLTMADVQASEQAGWNLIIPTGAAGRLNADGRCGLTGSLTGGGTFTYYTGFIRTDLKGNWSAFTGQINAVTDDDGGDFRITNNFGYGNAALYLGAQVYAHHNGGGVLTIPIGELSGHATSFLAGGLTGGNTTTYQIGGRNTNSTFGGVIANRTGPTALNKVGTGTLTLYGAFTLNTSTSAGSTTATLTSTADLQPNMPAIGSGIPTGTTIAAIVDATTITLSAAATTTGSRSVTYPNVHTHTGATTVSAGALLVNGVIANSAVNVLAGATLGGTGRLGGSVTFQSGSTLAISPGGGLTFSGSRTFNGTVNITAPTGTNAGTYTIFNYSGALGSPNFQWVPPAGSNLTATFDTSEAGVVKAVLASNTPSTLVWSGAVGSVWDTAANNWTNNGTASAFKSGDHVSFNDAAVATTVEISSTVSPATVAFANTTKNFTLGGTGGGLTGSTGIGKSAAGKVTLYGANSHSGSTTIAGGVLALGNDGATTIGQVQNGGAVGAGAATTSLGSGAIFINSGGQLRFGGRGGATVYTFISANPITFNGGTLVSFDGQQKLTGGISVGSTGAVWHTAWASKDLWINGALTGLGPITIDDLIASGADTQRALVRIDSANNPYSGTVTINALSAGFHGGRLQIENDTALSAATIINQNTAVPALLFTTATPQLGALGGAGSFMLPSSSLTVGGNGASTTFSGTLSGAGALIKAGAGTFTLAGSNTYTGTTTVAGGILRITGSSSGSSSFLVSAGTTLEVSGGTLSVSGPINNQGTMRLLGNVTLSSSGTFTNQGVLDLINGPQALPANFVNQGTVLDSSAVKTREVTMNASSITVSIQSFVGHQYQLQKRPELKSGAWTNVGSATAGTGSVLNFSDPVDLAGRQGFYRVVVSP